MERQGGGTDQGKIGELALSLSEAEKHTFSKPKPSQGFLGRFFFFFFLSRRGRF